MRVIELEKMGDFFDNRLDGYDEHQLNTIDSAKEFYKITAEKLPAQHGAKILDLGCGTGLELNRYFEINPGAIVTGIDLATSMLKSLKNKFHDKDITLINDSYFKVPFGVKVYDAAVSVESLHHFTLEQKILLYKKLHESLKDDGYFILTDYIIESEEDEKKNFQDLAAIKKELNIHDNEFYHYDTPLTRQHETIALIEGGFSKVEFIGKWSNTVMIKAVK